MIPVEEAFRVELEAIAWRDELKRQVRPAGACGFDVIAVEHPPQSNDQRPVYPTRVTWY